MGFFDWLGDQNMQTVRRRLSELACEVGCAYCCHVGAERPDLLPAEAFRIVAYLRSHEDALGKVKARLVDEGGSDKAPCLFLDRDRCTIYAVRPMRCRAQTSPDAELCRQNYLGQRKTMPLLSEPALLYKSLRMGLRLGLRDAGVQSAPLRLTETIRLALDLPDVWGQWFEGSEPFADLFYPEPADESRLIAQFMRQNRGQLWAARETMQPVISACLNAPGRWARSVADGDQAFANLRP
jgi:hypothetical protein